MDVKILNMEEKFNNLLKIFFKEKIYKSYMLDFDNIYEEWLEYIYSKTNVKQKILLCLYDSENNVNNISKILNSENIDTIKVEFSRLAKLGKIKCVSVDNKVKTYKLIDTGLSDLYFISANFIRESKSMKLYAEKNYNSNVGHRKYINKINEYLFENELNDIRKCLDDEINYIEISLNNLSLYDPELSDFVIEKPIIALKIFEDCIDGMKTDYTKKNKIIKIRFRDLPNADTIKISERRNIHLNKLVQLSGIIKRKSRPQPRISSLEYLCTNPSCNFSEDKIVLKQDNCKLVQLKSCPKCKSGVELINENEKDTQFMVIEEDLIDIATNKANVDNIKCILQDDLTDQDKDIINDIGSKVVIVGILKSERKIAKGGGESVDSIYYIDVNNVINDSKLNDIVLSKEDVKEIKEFGKKNNSYEELKENFLPEIMGYENIKESLLLQLFSGISVNGSRAESHILLLGDPGVAKSQMTKLQSTYAKKSMYSSGSGSSKAGLTGAVIKDEITGDYILEAGAMSKSNGGIMAIDEMDKMTNDDTGVMHEALEHGEITINKANINATINCKCSVLASANPKFGKFNPDMDISNQINFPPALLSRFDLIFIIRDIPNKKRDSKIADHILSQFSDNEKKIKYDTEFYKKYIHYCKENINPIMQDETIEYLKAQYVKKRTEFDLGHSKIPLGARQLNGWIRFSFALAKANFSSKVTLEHSKRAIEIFEYCWEKLGSNNLEIIEDSTFKKDPKDGLIYSEILRIMNSNKSVKKESLEKIFSENKDKMIKIINLLVSDGKIFEPRKGTYKLVGGCN